MTRINATRSDVPVIDPARALVPRPSGWVSVPGGPEASIAAVADQRLRMRERANARFLIGIEPSLTALIDPAVVPIAASPASGAKPDPQRGDQRLRGRAPWL